MATLFYAEFKSVISQVPTAQQLIPAQFDKAEGEGAANPARAIYEYEPSEEAILEDLLPRNVWVQIFRALLENNASFYGAQMSRDGQCDPQCRRDDHEASAVLQPPAPGPDHQGTDRNHFGRRSALRQR